MKKKGFTLIEVIFAIAIVGIISAIVIPLSYHSFAERIYGTKLKKVTTLITNAAKEAISDEGASSSLAMDDSEYEYDSSKTGFYYTTAGAKTSNSEQGAQYFLTKYFTTTNKNCGSSGSGTCVGEKYYSSEKAELGTVPNDFYCVKIITSATICMKFEETDDKSIIIVDLNSSQGPNMTGVDTFAMYIDNDGFLNDIGSENDCNTSSKTLGAGILDYAAGCFEKAVNNGWKINK